jgi:hypothetical protein
MSQTLEALKAALANSAASEELRKSFSQSGSATTGLTYYDLEAPAKTLYPVLTPLRNIIPRVTGKAGIQANWRAITGINTGNVGIGISEGLRGGIIATSVAEYLAAYRFFGLDDYVTFEAESAGAGFDDVNARAKEGLLRSLMLGEERIDLGGNTSIALGTTPTPSLAASGSGTSLTNVAHYVVCVALTHEAYLRASVAGGIAVTDASRVIAGGQTDTYKGGHAQKSSVATVTPTAGQQIAATVTPVNGAVAYAWFWGTTSGSEVLGAITTINSVVITALATGTQTTTSKFTSDQSTNDKVYDGLLSIALKSGSGAYVKTMATGTAGTGTPLTSDSAGGITEIDTALASFWDNYKLSPDCIWVSSQEMKNLQAKILNGSSTAAQRFVFTSDQSGLVGGISVRAYLNKFSLDGATAIPIKLHPNLPNGTILFTTSMLPYPLSGVSDVFRKLLRRDYYAIDWPLVQRKREYGVYFDGVLQHYFPPSLGVITNIANG